MTNPETPILYTFPFAEKRIIEIGSGAGGFTLGFLTRAREIVCIEKDVQSHQMLEAEWQENHYPGRLVHRQIGFEELVPVDLGQFDFAIFANSF